MHITPDNRVQTRFGEYPCENREQAEALLVSLKLRQRELEHRRAQPRKPEASSSRS